MSEDARAQIAAHVPRGTLDLLDEYVALLRAEAPHQNLVAWSTLDHVWQRHILDSWQLVGLAPAERSNWLDIGSGAGLPGIVVAIASEHHVTCVEPRIKRAEFLGSVVQTLGLASRVTILQSRVETVRMPHARIISARAVATLDAIFAMAAHVATADTLWLLPKGRSAQADVAAARETWQGAMRFVPSLSDGAASIVVAHDIRRRNPR